MKPIKRTLARQSENKRKSAGSEVVPHQCFGHPSIACDLVGARGSPPACTGCTCRNLEYPGN